MDVITFFTVVFYSSLLFPILAIIPLFKSTNKKIINLVTDYLGPAYVILVFLLIAFRPLGPSGFSDSEMYIHWFNEAKFKNIFPTKDVGFGLLIYLTSKILTVRMFFVLCTVLSFGILFWVSKTIAGRYWFFFFLGCMASLYFWNHQVFTIRQGLASIIFLAGLFQKRYFLTILLFLVAVSFHKSFLLPFICYFIVHFYPKTPVYLVCWVLAIPVSYFFGHQIGELVSIYLPEDVRYYYRHQGLSSIQTYRWDVVFYSFLFILIPFGYRSLDQRYSRIYNLYILTNIFVLLFLQFTGGFIHRFAYLSWFLSPVLLYYPLFKNKIKFSFQKYFWILIFFYFLIIVYLTIKIYNQDYKFIPDQIVIKENINFMSQIIFM